MSEIETPATPLLISRRGGRLSERVHMRSQNGSIEPILIGKKECATALGVSVRTIENLISRKELPARKVGRRTLIPYRALQAFARHDHPTAEEVRG